MNPVGSVIAGYRVQRVVGSGGMGTVYAVRDPQLPRTDALKVLSAELSADPQFRGRFMREADIAAMLDHPNIVSVYDRGETDGKLWIAMQFVDGTDADAALQAGTMTAHRALHIVSAVADALDYAHGRNMIHRDVKPANFMLTGPIGPDERVLLGDFGIARALDDAMHHTATGSIVATMPYASPEAINGTAVDGRTDQYSLACSLVRLLTGKLPFGAATGVAAVMMAHLTQPPPRVSELAPWLPPALDDVIAKAMAKEPGDRWPSCRAFVDAAMAAFTGAVDIGSAPTTLLSRAGLGATSNKSHRVKLLAALGGVVIIVGATATVLLSGSDDHPPGSVPHTATPQSSAVPLAVEADLPKLLLQTDQLNAIMADQLVGKEPSTDAYNDDSITYLKCPVGAVFPLQRKQYADTGYKAMYSRVLSGPNAEVAEGVVAFDSADLAQTFVARQSQLWQQCNGDITIYPTADDAGGKRTWTPGRVQSNDGILSLKRSLSEGNRGCEHALTVSNNIVIDVLACRTDLSGTPASTIATQIRTKIPHA